MSNPLTQSPSKFLTALVILQAGVIVGLVAGNLHSPGLEPVAHGQIIPDPANQQMQTNELLKGIDAKLTRIVTAVEGELKVRGVEAAPAK